MIMLIPKNLRIYVTLILVTIVSLPAAAGVRQAVPPPDYTEEQVQEWSFGRVASWASKCGLNEDARKLWAVIKVSPYAKVGRRVLSTARVKACGKVTTIVNRVMKDIDKLRFVFEERYGCNDTQCN